MLSCGCLLLELKFRSKTIEVTPDSRYGETLVISPICHRAVMSIRITIYIEAIPLLRVAHVINGHIILLAPEERNRREALFLPKHISCRDGALPLCYNPMLNTNVISDPRIRPTRNIAHRVYVWSTSLKECVD